MGKNGKNGKSEKNKNGSSSKSGKAGKKSSSADLRSVLRVPADRDEARELLERIAPDDVVSGPEDKEAAAVAVEEYAAELADLQERFFADAMDGEENRMLIVLQGMDTSGKGGVTKHVMGLLNPAGLRLHSFKVPSEEEKKHDFLWRVRNVLPDRGQIGIFDRSQYEDVLVVKVHEMVDAKEIERRYEAINEFEAELAASGVTILKFFLRISPDEQRERLLARLDDPTKHWKFNAGDIAERRHWVEYQDAYFDAITRCNTDQAPWYMIPSDRKWYRNWAIGQIMLETLREIDPQYPDMDLDVDAMRELLATTDEEAHLD